jgi:chromosome segregation ATPase
MRSIDVLDSMGKFTVAPPTETTAEFTAGIGTRHFAVPVESLDTALVERQVRETLGPNTRELNQSDLESWERDINSLKVRQTNAEGWIATADTELRGLNQQIDKAEEKLEALEELPQNKAGVRQGKSELRAKLVRLQDDVTMWSERRGRNQAVKDSCVTLLAAMPWATIKQLQKERELLA